LRYSHRLTGRCAVTLLVVACNAARAHPPNLSSDRQTVATAPPEAPTPITRDHARRVVVVLTTEEHRDTLADGVTYGFWTFNRTVPGPLIRIRLGDTVQLSLRNDDHSRNFHSINLHAVSGPGGGAWSTMVGPGESKSFEWVALNPGLFLYHCHTPSLAVHISNGMYGLILVEPPGGLPPVDREYYLVKGEFYTRGATGQRGLQPLSPAKLRDERPEYVVWNGRLDALTGRRALRAVAGETVRLFIGNAGPNLTMSFHVVGEVFDRVYPEGAIGSQPWRNVQTTAVPSGGSTIVEFKVDVPGTYHLVDHSYSRLEKGVVGVLEVTGSAISAGVFRPLDHGP
jgi:nitrite reductase (NO-forming)